MKKIHRKLSVYSKIIKNYNLKDKILFSEINARYRNLILKKIGYWIKKVAKDSIILSTLTPREMSAIELAFRDGHGDILLDNKLKPLSQFLVYRLYGSKNQDLIQGHLGYNKKERRKIKFKDKIYEIGLIYVADEQRGKGYYRKLSSKYFYNKDSRFYCLNTSTIEVMVVSAEAGLIPISFNDFPLSSILLNFCPFPILYGGRRMMPDIPTWMTKNQVYRIKHFLSNRFNKKGKYKELLTNVTFVSMQDRKIFIKQSDKEKSKLYKKAKPHFLLYKIEEYLYNMLVNSYKYKAQNNSKTIEQTYEDIKFELADFLYEVLMEVNKSIQTSSIER